jgi:hypothetical protein
VDGQAIVLGREKIAGMISRLVDRFRGSGEFSVSVPPFDGALRPNELLETGVRAAAAPAPDNLCRTDFGVVFTSGDSLLELDGKLLHRFTACVTALASHEDCLAAGLEGGGVVIRGGEFDGRMIPSAGDEPLNCPTALAFRSAKELIVANGSARHAPSRWKHDLLESGCSGSVWRIELDTGRSDRIGRDLGYPYGLLPLHDGSLLVSESWRHRLLRLHPGSAVPAVQLTNLPAYPARIGRRRDGGAWVAMFAPRRRLVEFVLREPDYRNRMMREIPSEYWIAPALTPMSSFLEPLQGGTLKQLARLKPWAPSRSYGLIVELDDRFQPVASLHSRADGKYHGIRSVIEFEGGLLAASAGADAVLKVQSTSQA